MPNNAVPTLSTSGWVEDIVAKADVLFSHFFVSDYYQSHYYIGHVHSLPFIIQDNEGDEIATRTAIQNAIQVFFDKYFHSVEVTVGSEVDSNNLISLTINAVISNGKQTYSLGRVIQVQDTAIKKIIKINNDG